MSSALLSPSLLLQWVVAMVLTATTCLALAQAPQLQAGRNYTRLDPPLPVATGSRIEVIEFFYYGCPICYEFQPHFSRWQIQAPEYVAVRRVPVLSSENWEPLTKLYYALEILGELNRLHWPVYDNFHFDGVKLNDERVMADWVSRNGIDRQKFVAAYSSAEVAKRLEQSREMVKTYDVRGVPTVVIDGKYAASARLAGGTRQLAQIVDLLVKQARKERPN